MHDEKFKRVATPHTVTKSKARAASHRFAPRKPSPLTNSRAKADMYKFETRARHMYLETHPAYVNREEKSEQTEEKTTKRVSTGGASPLTLLFPTRVKISLVLFFIHRLDANFY